MNDNELVEDVLSMLNKAYPNNIFLLNYLCGKLNIDKRKANTIIEKLESEDLINNAGNRLYKITLKGSEICKNGGWTSYENTIIKKQKDNEEKTKFDLVLAKWQVKTFWWIFGLAIVGSICGIISLLMQLIENK